MNANEMKHTVVFHYDKDSNAIITTSKSNLWVGLKGGVWQKKGYRFPLNKTNIDLLFKDYKHDVTSLGITCFWRLSLVEAMAKFLKDEIGLAGSLRFLHSLTLDKIDKYPIVYKSPNTDLQPFSNQKVSQYWQQYVKHHAMLWEMGPLKGDTLIITDKGIIKLKDYNDELVANPEGLHKSTELIKKQAKELIEVETYHGMKITGSPEHEIKTSTGTKTFSELVIGNNLLIGFPNVYGKNVIEPQKARALGMLVAEGHYEQPQIEFNLDENIDLVQDIVETLKPLNTTVRNRTGKQLWRAWWSIKKNSPNKFPKELIKEDGEKVVPEIILKADKQTQIAFMYGYFRGDGTVLNRDGNFNFKLTETSEKLAEQIQLMLFNMGITTKRYEYDDVNAFNLTASNPDTRKMMEFGLIDKIIYEKQLNNERYGKGTRGNNGRNSQYKNGHLISKIISIKRYISSETIYCLRMENKEHWFYGNGIVVHNTGKTRGVIEAFEIKKKKGLVKRCLVVCPVSMLDKWVEEIEKWSGNTNAVALKGSKADKIELLTYDFDWFVTNFETLPIVMEQLEKTVNNKWFIVLDEFTKIKNLFAKRTKTCIKLGKMTDHKTILSGTPITQNAYDVFAPFMFLDNGETFGLNYENFIDKYFWRNGYRKVAMHGSLEKISEKIFDSSTRFRKAECIDIPEKIYDTRILELPAYNKEKYDEMVQYAITQLMDSEAVTAPIILVQLLRLSQITSGFVVDEMNRIVDFKEQPKLDAFQDILDSSNGSKIIVWSRFKHDVDKIYEKCNKSGVKAVKLYSDVRQDDRTRNIKAFQEDKATKVIIGTAGTGGHGIDLVAGSIVVYYSNNYSLEQRLQSEDRAHRAGQKNQVTYIDLLCKGTVDLAIYKILRAKKSIADVVTRDNIFEMLRK